MLEHDALTVAELLGLSRAVITKWCRGGVFPHARKMFARHTSCWVIPDDDLQDFEFLRRVRYAKIRGEKIRRGIKQVRRMRSRRE